MISTFTNRKCSDYTLQFPTTFKSFKSTCAQQNLADSPENRGMLMQEALRSQYKAMFQDRVKSAKIMALQRRFSSCSNLGRQGDSGETSTNCTSGHDNHSNAFCNQRESQSVRSSSLVKTPHFISSLYHSVEQNPSLSARLVHSSSVETPPPPFSSTRLRSGSCPQVWTPVKFTCQIPLYNNGLSISTSHQNSPAPVRSEIKHLSNARKNSIPCSEKFHEVNVLLEKPKGTSVVNVESKSLGNRKKAGLSISFGSTDSNLAFENCKNETTTYPESHSSYEDLNDESPMNRGDQSDFSPDTPTLSSDDFESQSSYLKRTVSTECFNLQRNNFNHKSGTNDCPSQVGLQNSVRNSFFSNTDIYNLKSPVEIKRKFNKAPSRVTGFTESVNVCKLQDSNSFRPGKSPNLTKTVSEQYLSSLQKTCTNKPRGLNGSILTSQSVSGFDKDSLKPSNKNSVYVSSVFLNLSNTKNQIGRHQNVSRVSSASPPVDSKQNSFSRRPSTLCLNRASPCKSKVAEKTPLRLPTPMSPHCKRKLNPSELSVLKVQKEEFEKLLEYVKEATFQRDQLKVELHKIENLLVQRKQEQLTIRPKSLCIQELKRSNFVLKSEILRLTQHLKSQSQRHTGNESSDPDTRDIKGPLFDFNNSSQRWSYNPSYDGRH